ncbi:NAD-dependent epimerase/dehydratase family protein [Nocardioides sp.]|uniref:NAD-dependent epimerase/dehydratase family protein n=1 Tax=Nocardioides sp. TaxID=35761 RepID=UPI0035146CCA
MRLLVLGGTRFLSRTIVDDALARGHEVVVACRGVSGAVPEGVVHVAWDRAAPAPPALVAVGPFDAVVDVARSPAHVRRALDVLAEVPWVFVSTISVYADDGDPAGPGVGALHSPLDDADPAASAEAYGGLKVRCEQLVLERAARAVVVRPGLIVGPGDPSGRFAYWAARRDREDAVLAPGSPTDPIQVIDVRDLAGWIVALAEHPPAEPLVLDAVGPVTPMADLLADCVPRARLTWVGHDELAAAGVEMWAGPDSVGLWLPRPGHDGMVSHDDTPARAAGLRTRPVADTAADTAAWLAATPDAVIGGITAARERDLLAARRPRRP